MDEESRKYLYDAGRGAGHTEAVLAAYEVLSQKYGGDAHDEHLAEWRAVMTVIQAIQKLQS